MNHTLYRDEKTNALRISRITKIEDEMPFTGFGIKYVVSGEETYYANSRKYKVNAGEYLIGNDFTESIVAIHHNEPVEGICIDVSAEIIAEVAEYHDAGGVGLKEFLLSDQLFVNKYDVDHTSIGRRLRSLDTQLRIGSFASDVTQKELFYGLAESVVIDQLYVFEHLRRLRFKKAVTNEEVFRAVLHAKGLIDEQCLQNLSLDALAATAGISKYHFIRVFKSVFGQSPYRYQKSRRLHHARHEIRNGSVVSDVALLSGYADLQSFSKAFKQEFGYSPTHLRH